MLVLTLHNRVWSVTSCTPLEILVNIAWYKYRKLEGREIKRRHHFLPVVSLDDTSPKGDGSMRRYFCGEDTGDITGAHLLLLGEAGLINGSKSKLLFRVAPQAITLKYVKYLKPGNFKIPWYPRKPPAWARYVPLLLASVS